MISSHVKKTLFSQVKISPLLWLHNKSIKVYLNVLFCDRNIIGSSSKIYINVNLRKFSENVWKRLSGLGTIFGESSEIFEKKFRQQNNTWLLVNMKFLFKCSTLTMILLCRRRFATKRANRVDTSTISHLLLFPSMSRLPVRPFDFPGDDSR